MYKIKVDELEKAVFSLFKAAGLKDEDAEIVTHCLLESELAGISTHGISMVTAHIKKCKKDYNLTSELKVVRGSEAFTICDAENSIGMLSAWRCIELAVKKVEKSGMHMVLCNNANTFSAAYCYAKYAVEHGKIVLVASNSPAQMAPVGGKEKLLGTNPIAIGIPADKEAPFILDMATSAVAKSKINQAVQNGTKKIPFGWATDENGIPTDEPEKAIKGLILPMAGAKGYGLSMAIDIISGLLSHASFLDRVGRFYSEKNECMNVGQSFVVIDPSLVYGNDFYSQMDLYFKRVRNSKAVGENDVLIPGDINMKCKESMLQQGVSLSEHTVRGLNELLLEAGYNELRNIN